MGSPLHVESESTMCTDDCPTAQGLVREYADTLTQIDVTERLLEAYQEVGFESTEQFGEEYMQLIDRFCAVIDVTGPWAGLSQEQVQAYKDELANTSFDQLDVKIAAITSDIRATRELLYTSILFDQFADGRDQDRVEDVLELLDEERQRALETSDEEQIRAYPVEQSRDATDIEDIKATLALIGIEATYDEAGNIDESPLDNSRLENHLTELLVRRDQIQDRLRTVAGCEGQQYSRNWLGIKRYFCPANLQVAE